MNVIPRIQKSLAINLRRNLGVSSILAQKGQATDSIQRLFVQMLKEYDQKAKAAPGKLVDASPEIEKELQQELERITKMYGGKAGVEMTKFPTFDFKDPQYDSINLGTLK